MCTAHQKHPASERGARQGTYCTDALWALARTNTGFYAGDAVACGDALGKVAAFDAGTVGQHAIVFDPSSQGKWRRSRAKHYAYLPGCKAA